MNLPHSVSEPRLPVTPERAAVRGPPSPASICMSGNSKGSSSGTELTDDASSSDSDVSPAEQLSSDDEAPYVKQVKYLKPRFATARIQPFRSVSASHINLQHRQSGYGLSHAMTPTSSADSIELQPPKLVKSVSYYDTKSPSVARAARTKRI